MPGGVKEHDRPLRSPLEYLLTILSIALVIALVCLELTGTVRWFIPRDTETAAGLATRKTLEYLWYAGCLGPSAVLIGYFALGWSGLHSRWKPAVGTAPKRHRASGRPPFRSSILGWIIKVCGFTYTLWLFGWDHPNFPENAMILLVIPCGASMYVCHRLTRRTFRPDSRTDERPPFLFLRSFEDDDKKSLQPNTWLARLHGMEPDFGQKQNRRSILQFGQSFHPARWFRAFLGLPADTVEEVLAIGTSKHGPLVAIGRPGERQVTSGADRMYVTDDSWQSVVSKYVTESAGIIIQPSMTEGVLWEIERVFQDVERRKILLSMVNFENRPDEYERFWLLMRDKYGVELLRSLPYGDRPCFIHFAAGNIARLQPVIYHPVPLWPLTGNAVDIRSTLAPYLRGLSEKDTDDTIPPEPPSVVAKIVSVVVLASVVAGFTWGIPALAGWLARISGL